MSSKNVLYIISELNTMIKNDKTESGYYKIGISKNHLDRLNTHQVSNPRVLEFKKIYLFDKYYYANIVESIILNKLKLLKYKVRGEWVYTNDIKILIKVIDIIVIEFEKALIEFENKIKALNSISV